MNKEKLASELLIANDILKLAKTVIAVGKIDKDSIQAAYVIYADMNKLDDMLKRKFNKGKDTYIGDSEVKHYRVYGSEYAVNYYILIYSTVENNLSLSFKIAPLNGKATVEVDSKVKAFDNYKDIVRYIQNILLKLLDDAKKNNSNKKKSQKMKRDEELKIFGESKEFLVKFQKQTESKFGGFKSNNWKWKVLDDRWQSYEIGFSFPYDWGSRERKIALFIHKDKGVMITNELLGAAGNSTPPTRQRWVRSISDVEKATDDMLEIMESQS